ncbi:hypothetical protein CHLRE_06g255150v5 [Chlamydomonas reinhardtii]|uniref:Uncharacterized protein n=1 Tax=Chlamydomonas reinhardtii TaxID=3055 RepID=A0A2K3DMA4_CHLRE|nr:uncharacterized protein CHLRE_06g255150v5 [Chlamydomonas reinhardtii]PNW81662.1 hypothetical protein CHLRE_06g255150v5 [Chlamydomonas reinhardtii]
MRASGAGSSDAAQPAPEQQPQSWNTLGVSNTGAEAAAGQGGVEPQAAMPHGPTCACCQPGRGAGPIRQVITYVDGVVLEVESADGSVVYLDQEDQSGEAAAAAGGRWGAAGGAWGEAGVVVEAEVVSVPTGADAAQYIVFEGEEEEVEEEEAGAGGKTGTREAGAARAGRFVPTPAVAGQPFVYVPDVELRGTGHSDSPSIY